MYCTENIYSYNRSIYAEQNEEVTIISHSCHVAIVEGKRGRFPVLFERLSDEMVVVIVDPPEPEPIVFKPQLSLF